MIYGKKWPEYAEQLDRMTINPGRKAEFEMYGKIAIAHKAQYLEIEKATGVPWPLTAVIHRRESPSDKNNVPRFDTYLGNGQPLNRVTTVVPRGRGPFSSFLAGAIDAYTQDELVHVVPPWPLEKHLFYAEVLNGPGYNNGPGGYPPMPSPYIFGGTNIQKRGKYPSDGHFDPTVMDTQPGCAPMLYMIAYFDTSVHFTRET